jgi:hypothetical protein
MLLFSPERLRDALAGTAWAVENLLEAEEFAHFGVELAKSDDG